MLENLRVTPQTLCVLTALMENPFEGTAGADILKSTTLKSGTIYPILARLEKAKWIVGWWEDIDESEEKRPRRKIYEVTKEGKKKFLEIKTSGFLYPDALKIKRPTESPVPLSHRELEVLQWRARGKTYEEIAIIMAISVDTALFHMRNVFRKLSVNNTTLAVIRAIRHKMLNVDNIY